jgi:hypothetical protein
MKVRCVLPMVALLAVGGPAAFAQTTGTTPSQQVPSTQDMDRRFLQMSTMMGQAQKAHGTQFTELMRKHMQLMQDQMQAMHSMMGAGSMMGGNGTMGGTGSSSDTGNTNMLAQMQTRMDLMQRMMEQMVDQQRMMMQPPASAK